MLQNITLIVLVSTAVLGIYYFHSFASGTKETVQGFIKFPRDVLKGFDKIMNGVRNIFEITWDTNKEIFYRQYINEGNYSVNVAIVSVWHEIGGDGNIVVRMVQACATVKWRAQYKLRL